MNLRQTVKSIPFIQNPREFFDGCLIFTFLSKVPPFDLLDCDGSGACAQRSFSLLGNNLIYHLPIDVSKPEISAGVTVSQLLVVNS